MLKAVKIKDISADALRFGEPEVGDGLLSDFHCFVNGDGPCVKIFSSLLKEELSLSHLLPGGVGFNRGYLL